MSDKAVLVGLQDFIIESLNDWTLDNCKPRPDERPEPMSGDSFLAIHLTEFQYATNEDRHATEIRGVGLSITQRIHAVPETELTDSVYLAATTGLDLKFSKIKALVMARQWKIANRIQTELNAIYGADAELQSLVGVAQVTRPFRIMNATSKPKYVEEDGMHSYTKRERDGRDGYIALRMTLYLTDFRIDYAFTEEDCS